MLGFFIPMRMTYTNIREQFLRNIGKQGSTDATIIADFNARLANRYQMVFATMNNYQTQQPKTSTTADSVQYYHYPLGVSKVDDCIITIGNVNYPLQVINSQHSWDILNAIQIQPSAIPQFIYPRRDDFGIWPIPRGAYTITFYYYIRDRSLIVPDYTEGTISLTNGDTSIIGTGTNFTPAMVGRWFEVTDISNADYGWWYRVSGYNSTTSLTLENAWQGTTTSSSVTFRIGQCPEIPEEGHILLVDGVTADFYAGPRADIEKATWFDNMFWTGQGNNSSRRLGDDTIKGGLIGLANRYSDRDDSGLVYRQPKVWPPQYKVWSSNIN